MITDFDRIAAALETLGQIQSAARFTFKLKFGETFMKIYKADKPDFDFNVIINAMDSEGNVIPDAPVPAGHSLTLTSDNTEAFDLTQDAADSRVFHAHVGSPGQANLTANLTDPLGAIVATGGEQITVTVGDPAAISNIAINLPE